MNGPAAARAFVLEAIAPTPWKNGGGTTREIAVWPPSAGMDAFDWRVSVADIVADGPFSAFPGIDRRIVLLDGDGVRLRARDHRFDHRLDVVGEPFAFAGDVAVDATLLGGPSRDFNVMTRRGRCHADIATIDDAWRCGPRAGTAVLLALAGGWRCDALAEPFGAGAGAVVPLAGGCMLAPLAADSRCLLVTLRDAPAVADARAQANGNPS